MSCLPAPKGSGHSPHVGKVGNQSSKVHLSAAEVIAVIGQPHAHGFFTVLILKTFRVCS
jgi:hypothetical protein